ncbi:hypothetical protein [Clostridium sp.]|uniref:hypothetical protein n=1 Tax=Clostridium sp. TaxID=1506 RepID=UPI002844C1DF|nr:hypothetical protein [Clostridium sp.]MDR3595069.1 hypothetical protein [Clostridium sp.]
MNRINLYFSESNEKDRIISTMLDSKYSPKDYIKEILYAIAKGENIIQLASKEIATEDNKEEYEEIEGLDGIDL